MFVRCVFSVSCFAAAALLISGCGDSNPKSKTPDSSTSKPAATSPPSDAGDDAHEHSEAGHGHSHERGTMMIADAGPYHVLLTAHLSKSGNELDIFFETTDDKNPQPQPIPVESFEAQATAGEGEAKTLTFEPAPPEERPAGEKSGTSSHFVAKAPWMNPEQALLVVAKFTVAGKEYVARWKDFSPKKFAHHVE